MSKKNYVSFSVMFLLLVFGTLNYGQINRPDLTVASITLSPTNPTICDKILFKAVIKNIGRKASPASVAAMWVGGETYPKKFNIPALNPGAAYTIHRTEKLSVAQNYRVRVYADYSHTVIESNENNNKNRKDFTVTKACPDLIVKKITITPANPTTRDVIKFVAYIVNIGNCVAPPTKAAMWIGGVTHPQLFSIPALNPGATKVIASSKRLTVAQNYRVRVQADYGNNAAECDETNNKNHKDFRVQ